MTKTIRISISKNQVVSILDVPKGVEVEIVDEDTDSYARFGKGDDNVVDVGLT